MHCGLFMRIKPFDDLLPNDWVRARPHKNSQMLQADTGLARDFDQPHIASGNGFEERHHGLGRRDGIGGVDNGKGRCANLARAYGAPPEPQRLPAQTILLIEPLHDFAHEPAGQRNFIECPALDPRLDIGCAGIPKSKRGICQPRPDECGRRRYGAELRYSRSGDHSGFWQHR